MTSYAASAYAGEIMVGLTDTCKVLGGYLRVVIRPNKLRMVLLSFGYQIFFLYSIRVVLTFESLKFLRIEVCLLVT